jgi:phytoene dehydrogenase-like protein
MESYSENLVAETQVKVDSEVVIVGGGHNGLVAATYLARAGKSVIILEANDEIGGATASVKAFPEFDAYLSRYSYLVSLLPDQIVFDLGINFETIPRKVSSYTPDLNGGGLYISRQWDQLTQDSFASIEDGAADAIAWQSFYREIASFAELIAPTMMAPLLTRAELKEKLNLPEIWDYLIEKPIGDIINSRFKNDLVKGVILTDALIGTFASAQDLQANICFLYHLIGNGTGEWKVPKGGMGALVAELKRVALAAGVEIRTNARVGSIQSFADSVSATLTSGEVITAKYLLSNAAPNVLAKLRGTAQPKNLPGAQFKINMLLKELPRLKSGVEPALAFAGTFHVSEKFSELETSFEESSAGKVPTCFPAEMYCHTLSDPSILSTELQNAGYQTLTLFGLHTPAELFDGDPEPIKELVLAGYIAELDKYLVDPISSVVALNTDGTMCIEAKSPLDLEDAIGLPRGNIFHSDLTFPFREEGEDQRWGVETDDPRIFICGAGARRGGGVSGIPGHNAAMAVLEKY